LSENKPHHKPSPLKGRPNPKHGEAIRGEKNPMFGKHHSEETRRKIAEKRRGTHLAPEYRQKLSEIRRGEKNGNWKGGITLKIRGIRASLQVKKWRKDILERDNYRCRNCGSTEKLEVHHIIPIAELPGAAAMPMNGVTLCKQCHKETKSYLARKRESVSQQFIIQTIPHHWQEYSTIGNYATTDDGITVIFVSDMGSPDYEFLVALHELIEVKLTQKHGVAEEDITAFDKQHLDTNEPGYLKEAPYHKEHMAAETIERIVATLLGVEWNDYEEAINKKFEELEGK